MSNDLPPKPRSVTVTVPSPVDSVRRGWHLLEIRVDRRMRGLHRLVKTGASTDQAAKYHLEAIARINEVLNVLDYRLSPPQPASGAVPIEDVLGSIRDAILDGTAVSHVQREDGTDLTCPAQ